MNPRPFLSTGVKSWFTWSCVSLGGDKEKENMEESWLAPWSTAPGIMESLCLPNLSTEGFRVEAWVEVVKEGSSWEGLWSWES